jgi:hypothetical protein
MVIAVYAICGLRERQQQTGLAIIALSEGTRKRIDATTSFKRIKKRIDKNWKKRKKCQ